MKVYDKKPAKEVIIVREGEVSEGNNSYEFYMLVPVYLGRATKVATARVVTEDNQVVTNLKAAARHFLSQRNETELAAQMPLWTKRAMNKIQVSGVDLVAKGSWPAFCESRGIDPRDVKAMQQNYFLDAAEAKQVGL